MFLTAYADDETVRRASRTEPFGYLLKPFEDVQLRTVIEMALYKHAAERRLRDSERRYVATLSSIGDAVIATDAATRITFMNPVAESLTGWTRQEAVGRALKDVFVIVNEDTREPVEDPAEKVLRLGTIVGLANHTVLIARDGREMPIDDYRSAWRDHLARPARRSNGLQRLASEERGLSRLLAKRVGELDRSIPGRYAFAARLSRRGRAGVSRSRGCCRPVAKTRD